MVFESYVVRVIVVISFCVFLVLLQAFDLGFGK